MRYGSEHSCSKGESKGAELERAGRAGGKTLGGERHSRDKERETLSGERQEAGKWGGTWRKKQALLVVS